MKALFGVEPPAAPVNPASPLTVCEELLATKMRFRKRFGLFLLAIIWGKGEKTMGRIVRARAPEWGEAGQDLSILDLPLSYLAADLPQEYLDSAILNRTSGLVDGKCYKTNTFRKNSALSRAQHANKVEWSALLSLNWQTPSGLSVEHTAAFLGRASETALVKLWGSHSGEVPSTVVSCDADSMTMLCNPRCSSSRKHAPRVRHDTIPAMPSPPLEQEHEVNPDHHDTEDGDDDGDHYQNLATRLAAVGIGFLDEATDPSIEAAAFSGSEAAAVSSGAVPVAVVDASISEPMPTSTLVDDVLNYFDKRASCADNVRTTDVTNTDALHAFNRHLLAEDTPNVSKASIVLAH